MYDTIQKATPEQLDLTLEAFRKAGAGKIGLAAISS